MLTISSRESSETPSSAAHHATCHGLVTSITYRLSIARLRILHPIAACTEDESVCGCLRECCRRNAESLVRQNPTSVGGDGWVARLLPDARGNRRYVGQARLVEPGSGVA